MWRLTQRRRRWWWPSEAPGLWRMWSPTSLPSLWYRSLQHFANHVVLSPLTSWCLGPPPPHCPPVMWLICKNCGTLLALTSPRSFAISVVPSSPLHCCSVVPGLPLTLYLTPLFCKPNRGSITRTPHIAILSSLGSPHPHCALLCCKPLVLLRGFFQFQTWERGVTFALVPVSLTLGNRNGQKQGLTRIVTTRCPYLGGQPDDISQ